MGALAHSNCGTYMLGCIQTVTDEPMAGCISLFRWADRLLDLPAYCQVLLKGRNALLTRVGTVL